MVAEILAWWWAPASGAHEHLISASMAWHGRLMVFAWGVMVPVSILLARYFKVMPGQRFPQELDRKFWWHGHRALGYAAAGLTALGLALVMDGAGPVGPARDVHGGMGWTLVLLVLAQIAGGHLRGSKGGPTDACRHGDHYDMTPRRIVFERVHKSLGVLALALAWLTLLLGLHITDAPRWMWLMLSLWWLCLLALALRLQSQGRCVDTYQAIWGLDPDLPGARLKPIGWGIRRLTGPAENHETH